MSLDIAHVFDSLFGDRNTLWHLGTRHESFLLLEAFYRRKLEMRESLTNEILRGPPSEIVPDRARADKLVYDVIAYLKSKDLPLNETAENRFSELSKSHPQWEPSKFAGMSRWMESGWVGKKVVANDSKFATPLETISNLFGIGESIDVSRREYFESAGVAITKEKEWGVDVLTELCKVANEIPCGLYKSNALGDTHSADQCARYGR